MRLSDYRAVGLAIGSCVKDNNPLGTQKTISLDFDEEYRLVRAGMETSKF